MLFALVQNNLKVVVFFLPHIARLDSACLLPAAELFKYATFGLVRQSALLLIATRHRILKEVHRHTPSVQVSCSADSKLSAMIDAFSCACRKGYRNNQRTRSERVRCALLSFNDDQTCDALWSSVLQYTLLWCTILYCTTLHCTLPSCSALYRAGRCRTGLSNARRRVSLPTVPKPRPSEENDIL